MKLTIEDLQEKNKRAEFLAMFGVPITPDRRKHLLEEGFAPSEEISCMDWIWCQWLLNGPVAEIRSRVQQIVDRGMEMQEISPRFFNRPTHDLFLLQCAIFASDKSQLENLAERVVDASGYKKYKPQNNGELFESAWCGMFKYWVLGDRKTAVKQAEVFADAYRFPNLRTSSKPLVTAWLKEDWELFVKQQKKEFSKHWERIRKDRWQPIKKENGEEITVSVDRFSPRQSWCWSDCGMALLAHRQGVQVATDDFWFPPHALKCACPS